MLNTRRVGRRQVGTIGEVHSHNRLCFLSPLKRISAISVRLTICTPRCAENPL